MKNNSPIVLNTNDMHAAYTTIQNATSITLLTHTRPDGDAIGSCAALSTFLKKLGKQVETIYPDKPEFAYTRKPEPLHIATHTTTPDLIISCDSATLDRLYYPDAFKTIPLINIDHHISNSIPGTYNFVHGSAASACEIVYHLLHTWNAELIDSNIAECLLFGIMADTQIFKTPLTNADTLRISADLIDQGADLSKVKTELLSNKNPQIITLWGTILNRIEISKNNTAVWTYILQSDLAAHNLTLTSIVGFNNFLSQISDIDTTLLFYELDNKQTKVSLRSKERDINALAQNFGGGGHKNAAGILSDTPLKQLMEEITKTL